MIHFTSIRFFWQWYGVMVYETWSARKSESVQQNLGYHWAQKFLEWFLTRPDLMPFVRVGVLIFTAHPKPWFCPRWKCGALEEGAGMVGNVLFFLQNVCVCVSSYRIKSTTSPSWQPLYSMDWFSETKLAGDPYEFHRENHGFRWIFPHLCSEPGATATEWPPRTLPKGLMGYT